MSGAWLGVILIVSGLLDFAVVAYLSRRGDKEYWRLVPPGVAGVLLGVMALSQAFS